VKTRITKTLLDSWNYLFECYEGSEESAMEEFLHTLNRDETPTNEAQQHGIDFETLVYAIDHEIPTAFHHETDRRTGAFQQEVYDVPDHPYYQGAKRVAEYIKGGQWQVHVDANITVDGREFWLHGFCDVVKAGMIYDIKFKTKSLSSLDLWGSYKNSSQHCAYLRCLPEAYGFMYMVSDGEDLYTEEYDRKNSRPIEEIIHDFMTWLNDRPELLKIYEEKWVCDG